MKAKEAAAVFDTMTSDLDLVAKILGAMSAEDRAKILEQMNEENAARLTKMMDPGGRRKSSEKVKKTTEKSDIILGNCSFLCREAKKRRFYIRTLKIEEKEVKR